MRPRRQPPGYDLSRGLPFRQETNDVALCVRGERVARDDYELVDQRVGDLVYDAGQGGKAQREHDGIGIESHGVEDGWIFVPVTPLLVGKSIHGKMQKCVRFHLLPAQLSCRGQGAKRRGSRCGFCNGIAAAKGQQRAF